MTQTDSTRSQSAGKRIFEAATATTPFQTADKPVIAPIRIQASSGWVPIQLGELWDYRELLYFLTWRDIKVRYKQTVMGILWAVIQPIFTMVIFSLFFGRLAGVSSDGVPYPLFSLTALVPWTFFANALAQGSNSLVSNSNMLKKVYFPRLMMPTATVLAGLVDFALAFIILIAMMAAYRVYPTANVIWLPFFLLLAGVTSLGVSLWFAAMSVQFRDVRYIIPFLTQAWLFVTPIAYSSTMLPQPWRTLYGLNPMAGVVDGFRWTLLGTATAPGLMIVVSSLAALAILISGVYYFRRMEKTFADIA